MATRIWKGSLGHWEMAEPPSNAEPGCLHSWLWASLAALSSQGRPWEAAEKLNLHCISPFIYCSLWFLGSPHYYKERYFTSNYCFIVQIVFTHKIVHLKRCPVQKPAMSFGNWPTLDDQVSRIWRHFCIILSISQGATWESLCVEPDLEKSPAIEQQIRVLMFTLIFQIAQ